MNPSAEDHSRAGLCRAARRRRAVNGDNSVFGLSNGAQASQEVNVRTIDAEAPCSVWLRGEVDLPSSQKTGSVPRADVRPALSKFCAVLLLRSC